MLRAVVSFKRKIMDFTLHSFYFHEKTVDTVSCQAYLKMTLSKLQKPHATSTS